MGEVIMLHRYVIRQVDLGKLEAPSTDSKRLTRRQADEQIAELRAARKELLKADPPPPSADIVHGVVELEDAA